MSGWASGTLGKRNADQQRFIATSSTLSSLTANPYLADAGDSLFIQVDADSTDSEQLVRWQPEGGALNKKIVWCLSRELAESPSLHELALDKKLKELAPDGMRIIWGDASFIRDALEWVLSF